MAESDVRPYDYGPQLPKPNAAHLKLSTPKFYTASPPPPSKAIHLNGEALQSDDTLRKRLTGNTLNTHKDFLEQLLPRKMLPFPININLLDKLSVPIGANPPVWNERNSCFCQPPTHFGETAICQWLNNIGTTMGLVYGRPCERLWWSGYCGPPLVDSSIQRKPDLILLDRSYYDRVLQKDCAGAEWAFVRAFGVLHRPYIAKDSSNIKAYLTFLHQPHRRFTISLSFFNINNGQFSITVTDRAGRIRINKIDLMGNSVENGLLMLSTLAFLMFGSSADIGLDPHFEINPSNGQVTAIQCESRRFEVVDRIHTSPSLFGRGTQVWIVVHQGIKYVLKDSWVREDCVHNEVVYLRKMVPFLKDLEDCVPTLLCGGEVIVNGREDSTRHYRSARSSHRIHRRAVTSPVGESIISFKSKKEFIRVLISVIETHRYLYDRVGILHCDLSLNNILLNRKNNSSEAIGLLIDYDYSVIVDKWNRSRTSRSSSNASDPRTVEKASTCEKATDQSKAQSWTPRTGTPPYMAIEALLTTNGKFTHKPCHDLESVLYIIIFICTFVSGPGLPIYNPEPSVPIRTWFCGDNTKAIGSRKLANLQDYDVAILPYFAPYWQDFIPFVKDLIIACFPVSMRLPNEIQYEQVLGILKKAYDTVREPTNSINQAAQTSKRPSSGSNLCRNSKRGRYNL